MAKTYPMASKDKSGGSVASDGGAVFDRSSDYGNAEGGKSVTVEGGGYADGQAMGSIPDTSPRLKHP